MAFTEMWECCLEEYGEKIISLKIRNMSAVLFESPM